MNHWNVEGEVEVWLRLAHCIRGAAAVVVVVVVVVVATVVATVVVWSLLLCRRARKQILVTLGQSAVGVVPAGIVVAVVVVAPEMSATRLLKGTGKRQGRHLGSRPATAASASRDISTA